MRPRRSAAFALACVAVFLIPVSLHAAAPPPGGDGTTWALREGEATRLVRVGDKVQVVETAGAEAAQRYLVTFDEPAVAISFAARVSERQTIARRFGSALAAQRSVGLDATGQPLARMLRSFDRLIAGAVVLAPLHAEAMLRAIPGVRAVFPDAKVTATDGASLAQIRADLVQQSLGANGLGVRVGIVDTGVDYMHPALGGGFGPGFRVAGGWDFVNGDADPRDDDGHGTHVAGILAGNGAGVLGVAPAATLYAYKVLDETGTGSLGDAIAALERCADPDLDPATNDRLDVVNLSFGSLIPFDQDPTSQAVDALDALGTVVVAAAGNYGIACSVATPAIAPGAIAVGSVDASDSLARTSSRGPTIGLRLKPDLVAPGEAIVSASPGGGVAEKSGTSMAAPHVAGVAALLRQLHPDWTREEMRSALVAEAKDLRRPAAQQGSGRLDAYAAANAALFVSPTSLAFGNVRASETGWVRAKTLRIHVRSGGVTRVNVSLASLRPPPWLEATLSASDLYIDPGVTAEVTLTLRSIADHPPLPDPLYIAEGVVLVQANGETCRVPFSIHEALKVEMEASLEPSPGVIFGGGRAWSSLLPGGATWLLQPGLYDALTFNRDFFTRDVEPILGVTDIPVASDTVLDVVRSSATSALRWTLRNERGAPLVPQTLSVQWSSDAGGAVAFLGIRNTAFLRFPVMKPGYRLDWWAYDPDGPTRYDIPGVEYAPLSNHLVGNDPVALRKVVEHIHVPAGDSLLLLDRLHFRAGFQIEYPKPFATPFGESFDLVRWTAPDPLPDHMRFGRRTWSLDPVKARALDPAKALALDPPVANGRTPLWDETQGDTLVALPSFGAVTPLARFTGHELTFGGGAAFPSARFRADSGFVEAVADDPAMPWLFRDAVGSIPAPSPVTFEIRRGNIILLGTVTKDQLLATGRWRYPVPDGPVDLVLRSAGWSVAGRPSTTTVTVAFDQYRTCLSPQWSSIVVGGSPAERIVFGQQRDPHVEIYFPLLRPGAPLAIEVRAGESGAWTPLVLQRQGSFVRAALPRMIGDISLRVRTEAPDLFAPITIEIAPAFVGERSGAENAEVVEARADAGAAHVAWRVGAPGVPLLVERLEPNAAWKEHGELVVDPDGIARFDDADVTPGGRYGYRLGGYSEVFVEIPAAQAGLALAIRPNPSSDGLVASVTLDRDAPVTIRVHDVQGRLVASRTWTGLGPGLHVLPVLARGKAKAGLYFVRLECEGATRDRRVTILE